MFKVFVLVNKSKAGIDNDNVTLRLIKKSKQSGYFDLIRKRTHKCTVQLEWTQKALKIRK